MNIDIVREISMEVFKTMLFLSLPALLVSLIVGLLVSLFQAVTQIQEFTLTFVPKMIAVFITIFFLAPWMGKVIIAFTVNLIDKLPQFVK
jgi:flagellar biosynthetic protein FliQ